MNNILLSDQQKEILSCNQNLVVLADPGSGKTTILSYKIALVLEKLENYQGVIAISYTNKASRELKDRTINLNSDMKSSFFGTIDKFYISEIIIPFSKILFNVKNEYEIVSVRDEQYKYVNDISTEKELFNCILFNLQNGKIFLEYISILANYIFDKSVECQTYLKSRYKYIFIDEYQDCNKEKHALFLKIVNLGIIGIAVGDPNQSIFSFTGCSPAYIYELSKKENFSVFYLTINRRSHPSIINYAMKFLNPQKNYKVCDDLRVFGIKVSGVEKQVANWIDNHVDGIKKLYKIDNYSDICVLTRSNGTAQRLSTHLSTAHVYYCSTPLEESSKEVDIFGKQIISYILSDSGIYLEVIFDEIFPDIKSKKRVRYISIIKEIKANYEKNKQIDEEKFFDVIYELFGFKIDVKNIQTVLSNEEYLNSYKPLDKSKLSIMTIHKSKGLEFKAVIILDLQKGFPFYDYKTGRYENIVESMCIHYVSLTRAKDVVILIYNDYKYEKDGNLKKIGCSSFIDAKERPDLIMYRNSKGHF